jgi:hypothetical protein
MKDRRVIFILCLFSGIGCLSGCDQNIHNTYVPKQLVDGDTLYIGQSRLATLERGVKKSYAGDDGYVESKTYKFFDQIQYDMESGLVSGISLLSDRGVRGDIDSIDKILVSSYGFLSRKKVLARDSDTTVFRIWKIGPQLFVWRSYRCTMEIVPTPCSIVCYIGPHADWEGLPDWE